MDRSSPGMIMGVRERQLTRRSDNQPFTIYDVDTTVGTLNTTVKQLAEHARSLIDVPLVIGWREKRNGDFTNRYLETLEPAPQGMLPVAPPQPQQPVVPQGFPGPSQIVQDPTRTQPPPAPPVVSNYDMSAPVGREEAIWRQTATKTAAQFNNKDLGEYWERVRMLLDFYRTGVIPHHEPPDTPPAADPPLGDDDDGIPF